MEIIVKKFKNDDAKKISEIIKENLIHVNCKDYEASVIEHMCHYFNEKRIKEIATKRTVFVAEYNNEIVGIASLDIDTILTVFINRVYHGQGIGKKMMKYIENLAFKENIAILKLPASLTAVNFYKKLGYREVGKHESKEFGKTITMEKLLIDECVQ